MISTTCDRCGLYISASDDATLAWGLETHRCLVDLDDLLPDPKPFDRVIRGLDHDRLESDVLCWLVGLYGRPFALYRADGTGAVVS